MDFFPIQAILGYIKEVRKHLQQGWCFFFRKNQKPLVFILKNKKNDLYRFFFVYMVFFFGINDLQQWYNLSKQLLKHAQRAETY